MRGLIACLGFVSIFFGTQSWANLSDSASDEIQTIHSYSAHLNRYYPTLDLEVTANLGQIHVPQTVLRDLQTLEDHLQGVSDVSVPLTTLACSRPECTGLHH